MSKKCPPRISDFITWIMRAPLINIPIFFIGLLFLFQLLSQQDRYHLFIPVGVYAQYIEYILLVIIVYFIFLAYHKRNDKVDECNFLMYYASKVPFLKMIFDVFIILFISYLFYYLLLLYIHKLNIPTENRSLEVKALKITNRGRKSCKPLMETDFLHKYNPKDKTLFYQFMKRYSFSTICLHNAHFSEGQTVILELKESPFGTYITKIKAKVY